MRRLFAVPLYFMVAAAPVLSAPAPKDSWGKAGITLAQYRQDALDCGLHGYYTDVSKTEDAKALVKASRELDAVTTGALSPSTVQANPTGPDATNSIDQMAQYASQQQHIVESARPDERYRNIKKLLVSKAEECLLQRGYSKFVLTDEQRHRLTKLKAGSEERRDYLYSLASNPAVLENQKAAARP